MGIMEHSSWLRCSKAVAQNRTTLLLRTCDRRTDSMRKSAEVQYLAEGK